MSRVKSEELIFTGTFHFLSSKQREHLLSALWARDEDGPDKDMKGRRAGWSAVGQWCWETRGPALAPGTLRTDTHANRSLHRPCTGLLETSLYHQGHHSDQPTYMTTKLQ